MSIPNLLVHFQLPPRQVFDWPPGDASQAAFPNAQAKATWMHPIEIPTSVFRYLADVKAPITIASVYMMTVVLLNNLNKTRGNRPWTFAKTTPFNLLVILHNIFLATFSAWTLAGLCFVLWNCWPSMSDPNFVARVANTICQITPAGEFGSSESPELLGSMPMTFMDHPNHIWSAGASYFSWFFYISKFYEVFDTFIILAKGKQSSFLQTYHHAGVMLCMWASVRYASPPALVGILLNSAIHTLMLTRGIQYTYFSITALGFRVPVSIKRSLTTLQIGQFLLGGAIAVCYLFIGYDISTTQVTNLEESHLVQSNYSKVQPAMGNYSGTTSSVPVAERVFEVQATPCLWNSGQTLALFVTLVYLAPLVYLFVSFFSRSYVKRVRKLD
ncbi:fatty acid elongase [Penicillium sp. IBT 35674x]|nr:fatty acid elongase [Penicillium sp. IBT 35674x]